MRMNWLVLALYPVGAIVVTMAERDDRSVARHGLVAPSIEIRASATVAVADPARPGDLMVPAWDVPMNRTQAGVRTDDPEPLAPPLIGAPGERGSIAQPRGNSEREDRSD